MKTLLISIILFSSQFATAYIPPYWMIMSRVAENHGNGPYRIQQDVTFYHGAEPVTVSEVWTIKSDQEMRLEVFGKGPLKEQIRLSFIYDETRRYALTENLQRKTSPAPIFNPEIYFHFRNSQRIKPKLVSLNIAPSESLHSKAVKLTPQITGYPAEPYVRLARTGGLTAYALGTPSEGEQLYPGIWIEQDQFNILKIRFKKDLEVTSSKYKAYKSNLNLPQVREILWKNQNVRVAIGNVSALTYGKNLKDYLSPSALLKRSADDPKIIWPSDSVISEFYTELR